MDALTISVLVLLAFVCFFVIDDAIIDLYALIKGLRPKKLMKGELQYLRSLPESRIAIMIANWQESDVIAQMVRGNMGQLQYSKHHFFLGVYPNDTATHSAARALEQEFPGRVHCVVNSLEGPTSKGQMLNEIARHIIQSEPKLGFDFDVFLMHDSEDILHPLSLQLINAEVRGADFVQIPIFSYPRKARSLVGGTYIEEFAELHTKDLLVRQALGGAIPSAGVGTAISRRLMLKLMSSMNQKFLHEGSLTEDYILGMSSFSHGFKSTFVSAYMETDKGREFIATREFFPNGLGASIRQKSRWIIGIAMQGYSLVSFKGSWAHKYYLYRDRKGPLSNLLTFAAMVTGICVIAVTINDNYVVPDFIYAPWFWVGSTISTLGAVSRVIHRFRAVSMIDGWKKTWAIPIRYPLGISINFFATVRGTWQYLTAKISNKSLTWAKTGHEMPEGFGLPTPVVAKSGTKPSEKVSEI